MSSLDAAIATIPQRMREIYERDGHHLPMLIGIRDGKQVFIVGIDPAMMDPGHKDVLATFMREHLCADGCDAYAFISETWIVETRAGRCDDRLPPSKHPERIDALTLHAGDRSGRQVLRSWEVDERLRLVLGEVQSSDTADGCTMRGRFAGLLEPEREPPDDAPA